MKLKLNHERFSDWNEAYEAWKKEANPPHPDSVAFTEQGCAMRMVWVFAKWLYNAKEASKDCNNFGRVNTVWIDVEHGLPSETGWYFVYAPEYCGSKYKEFHNGYGFSKFTMPKSGEGWWSIDDHHSDEYIELELKWRKNYLKEENPKVPVRKYVRFWMPLPPVSKGN